VHWVHLNNPTLTRDEFVEMLAARFDLSQDARSSKAAMLIELEQLLQRRHAAGQTTVLVVDEAQSLPLDLLEEIRLLANIETSEQKLLSVIMAGQPEIVGRLNNPALRQLKQRIGLRCALRPLTQVETLAYVARRIRTAGGVPAQIFTREAVIAVHESSGGVPRVICVICDNALLSGFAVAQRPVVVATVREVCQDFDLQPGPKVAAAANTIAVQKAAVAQLPTAAPPVLAADAGTQARPAPPVTPLDRPLQAEEAGPGVVFGAIQQPRPRFGIF
jgi:general secretion pathway protein A